MEVAAFLSMIDKVKSEQIDVRTGYKITSNGSRRTTYHVTCRSVWLGIYHTKNAAVAALTIRKVDPEIARFAVAHAA